MVLIEECGPFKVLVEINVIFFLVKLIFFWGGKFKDLGRNLIILDD